MSFNKEDRTKLITNLIDLCNSADHLCGLDMDMLNSLKNKGDQEKAFIQDLLFSRKKSKLLHDENGRILLFYSFVLTLGKKRLSNYELVVAAKEVALKLGLNSIGAAQMIHKIRIGVYSKETVSEAIEHFKVYSN